LRQRGSLTVWFTEAAIAAWRAEPRATRGGQPRYSALAITTALTLRAVFRLALRQTEGLIASLLRLLGLDLAAPDHSTMSRRGETLPVSRPPPGSNLEHRPRYRDLGHLERDLAVVPYARAPILINFSRRPVSDHCSNQKGKGATRRTDVSRRLSSKNGR
jgi:hypothetical protein